MRKFKKTLLILFGSIIIFVVVIIIFISPITKYLVEKYDIKYTGRQITMDWAYVNPFTGYVHLSNVKIYENKTDSVFLSFEGINANFSMIKLFSKNYEISELELNQPKGVIIQTGDKHDLNFNDIIETFTPKKAKKVKNPVHFSILSIKINDGEFQYLENITPINYSIKKVNIESSGIHWDADTIALKFSFVQGVGSGDMKGNFTINSKNKDYHFAVVANKFDLNIIQQYLKDLTNYGSFKANLDADFKSNGNFIDRENVTNSGMITINDFHFGKTPKEDYTSFDKLVLAIKEVSPKKHKYMFDSVSLSHPYIKYERYDYLDNLQTIFGKNGIKASTAKQDVTKFNLIIEIGNYIKIISKNFFKSNYKIGRLAVYNGDLKYNDFSLGEKFSAELNPLYITADSIDKKYNRVNVSLKSGIKPYGDVSVKLSINPKDSSDFDIHYKLQKVPATLFNPYIIKYTSFPLDRGTIELNGVWNVKNGSIQSRNHVVIIDPRLSSRIKNDASRWLPMRLVMYFVRERGNVIDYEVPITGNLKDPKFKLRDVIFDALTNIFVKPATTPYRIQVKHTETEIEKSLSLKWELRSGILESDQINFINAMVDFLSENPGANITVTPNRYAEKEREYIALYLAKKKYFLTINKKKPSEYDVETINEMSIKDPSFLKYINDQTKDSMLFTTQAKCERIIGTDVINKKFDQLNIERFETFIFYFKEQNVEKQVKFHKSKDVVPYNGQSFYKIEYKNEFPESLINAYQVMNDLNNQSPRNKFKKEREKNKSSLGYPLKGK